MFVAKNISTQRKFHYTRLNRIGKKKKKKIVFKLERLSIKLKYSKQMRLMKNSKIKFVKIGYFSMFIKLRYTRSKTELIQRNRFQI